MIGNAWPLANTGYSVLEEGDLDRQSFCLRITAWRVADPAGNVFAQYFATRREAEQAGLQWANAGLRSDLA